MTIKKQCVGVFPKKMQRHEPLLTATEMAGELGLSMHTLNNYIRYRNGPKPELKSNGSGTSKVYFKPSEVRLWWSQVKETL